MVDDSFSWVEARASELAQDSSLNPRVITRLVMALWPNVWQFLKPLSVDEGSGILSRAQALEIVTSDPYRALAMLQYHRGEILAAAQMRLQASELELQVITEMQAQLCGDGDLPGSHLMRQMRPRG